MSVLLTKCVCRVGTADVFSFFRKLPAGVKWSIIDRWATHPLLAKTVADRIRTELIMFPDEVKNDVIIMFSAHSLPLKVNTKSLSSSHLYLCIISCNNFFNHLVDFHDI